MIFIEKTAQFRRLKKTGYTGTDGQTDRPTDGRTDTTSYRDARTHLKTCELNINVIERDNADIGGVVSGLYSISHRFQAKLEELTNRHAAAVTLNRELDSQVIHRYCCYPQL